MTHKVVFRPSAQSDLFAIYDYIEKESGAGEQVLILRVLYGGQDYPARHLDETDS